MACVTACPSGVRYDLLIGSTRDTVAQDHRRRSGDRLLRAALFSVLPHPAASAPRSRSARSDGRCPAASGRWRASRRRRRSRQRPPPLTPAAYPRRGRIALLAGCVQRVAFGDVNAASPARWPPRGGVVPCRGVLRALSAHAGRTREAERLRERLRRRLAGLPIAVNPRLRLAPEGPRLRRPRSHRAARRAPTRHAAPVAAERRLPGLVPPARAAAAPPRGSVLRRIPALQVVEPAEQDVCCGSAGV